ncbi:MAG TPA: hypothetical protein PKL57_07755 [Candidatus Wallbacteria bacterium]|nr:hypothetical protein [Candidatus Wallbacteria bacterium]
MIAEIITLKTIELPASSETIFLSREAKKVLDECIPNTPSWTAIEITARAKA